MNGRPTSVERSTDSAPLPFVWGLSQLTDREEKYIHTCNKIDRERVSDRETFREKQRTGKSMRREAARMKALQKGCVCVREGEMR